MKYAAARTFFASTMSVLCLGAGATLTSTDTQASAANSQVPLCTGSNLLGAYAGYGAATGNFIYDVLLINVGHHSCRLKGYPTVQGKKDNRTFTLPISKHGTFAGNLLPTELSPRMSGRLLISTADNCNALNVGTTATINRVAAAHTYSDVSIKLTGSALEVDIPGLIFDIACGLEVSQMGWSPS